MSCLRYPWVCCQKIIMPINFTHAGVAFLSLDHPSHRCLVVNYTTEPKKKEGKQFLMFGFCQRQVGVAVCLCVCVRVCRLRHILPHSFGSNLSCHAVIMPTDKKKAAKNANNKEWKFGQRKKLFIENDYAQGIEERSTIDGGVRCGTSDGFLG